MEDKTDGNPALQEPKAQWGGGFTEKVASGQKPEGAKGGLGQGPLGEETSRQNNTYQNCEVGTRKESRAGRG